MEVTAPENLLSTLTEHHLLTDISGCGPSSAVKDQEVAADRAKLAALLPFHQMLVSLYDLLHSFMVIQGGYVPKVTGLALHNFP